MRWSQWTVEPGCHELQQGHLGRRVLHGDPVGPQIDIGAAAFDLFVLGVVEVVEEDLLGEREAPSQPSPPDGDPLGQAVVDRGDELDGGPGGGGHGYLLLHMCWKT